MADSMPKSSLKDYFRTKKKSQFNSRSQSVPTSQPLPNISTGDAPDPPNGAMESVSTSESNPTQPVPTSQPILNISIRDEPDPPSGPMESVSTAAYDMTPPVDLHGKNSTSQIDVSKPGPSVSGT